jgi:ferredoxin
VAKYNAKADKCVERIADEIKRKKNSIHKSFFSAKKFYINTETLDNNFFVESQCTGCGQCEKICPVQNIKCVDNRPVWQHHCEQCVACINWCPQKAIQYGANTKERRRYHNPEIKMSELMRK